MKLGWLLHSRSELLIDISQLSNASEQNFKESYSAIVKRLNSSIKYASDNPAHMAYPKNDADTLRIVEYSDEAYANNSDLKF